MPRSPRRSRHGEVGRDGVGAKALDVVSIGSSRTGHAFVGSNPAGRGEGRGGEGMDRGSEEVGRCPGGVKGRGRDGVRVGGDGGRTGDREGEGGWGGRVRVKAGGGWRDGDGEMRGRGAYPWAPLSSVSTAAMWCWFLRVGANIPRNVPSVRVHSEGHTATRHARIKA